MTPASNLVVLGLSLSSSWGNGHATTYRAVLRELAELGWTITFLERDVPWYQGAARDLPDPSFARLSFYSSVDDLKSRFGHLLAHAEHVLVGSYVPDGIEIIDWLAEIAPGTLSFYDIDTPVTLSAIENGSCDYLSVRQISLFDTYFSFAGGEVLDRLRKEWGANRADALYCSVDERAYRPLEEPAIWDLGYLGTYSVDRQPVLDRLLIQPARRLPHRRFVVAGPQYPPGIDWPANVDRLDHVPPAEHALFYARQRFTLNVTRADMARLGWSPSVRLFEAAACGVPVISDYWRGLQELFPSPEAIMIADDADQVVNILETTGERERRLVGATARQRVLASHTGRVRACELARVLCELGEANSPPLRSTGRH